MIRVHILTAGATSPNGTAFILPILKFKNNLLNSGFDIKINPRKQEITDCDYLIIESKFYKQGWNQKRQQVLSEIEDFSQKTIVIWCDQSDSTGTISAEVLPFVQTYAKAQLLVDKDIYLSPMYGSRIYTDYYHKNFSVTDEEYYCEPTVRNKNHLKKFKISWNSAFLNFGKFQPYWLLLAKRLPFSNCVPFSRKALPSFSNRVQDISVRMGTNHKRETVAFQRKQIASMFESKAKAKKISRKNYLNEVANSKICISPFGYGEITLKDFEVFLSGSVLLKPSMRHMRTWPDLFIEDETYVSHDWNFTNIAEKIEWLLANEASRLNIADLGQKLFIEHTIGKSAGDKFAAQFSSLFN